MAGRALDPLGFDLRRAARIQARGLREFGRDRPLRLVLLQAGTGKDRELHPASAEVDVALLGFHADIAEQAGEQRAMQLLIGCWRFIERDTEFRHQRVQLAVHVAPFAHARV